jgi:hypothetical protein
MDLNSKAQDGDVEREKRKANSAIHFIPLCLCVSVAH